MQRVVGLSTLLILDRVLARCGPGYMNLCNAGNRGIFVYTSIEHQKPAK